MPDLRGTVAVVTGASRGAGRAVALSRDGKTLASGGADTTVRLWRPER